MTPAAPWRPPAAPTTEELGPGPPHRCHENWRPLSPRQTFLRGAKKWDLAISFCFSLFFFLFCFFPPYRKAVLIGCLSSLMLQASLCRGGYSRFTPY